MKRLTIFVLYSSLFILIGCQTEATGNYEEPVIIDEPSETVTYLFSNDKNLEKETSYYDALLDFNRKYPDRLDSVRIVTEQNEDLVHYYNVKVYPTLIVIDEWNVSVRMEGYQEFNEIYNTLEQNLIEKIAEDTSYLN